jgi:transcription initiation factor IIE alpha subunit
MIKKPPFLQIPTVILADDMQGSDIKLYGYISALHNLKDGCTASDRTLGELVGVTDRQVRRILNKLEHKEFIRRHYNTKRTVRISIEPLYIITVKKK